MKDGDVSNELSYDENELRITCLEVDGGAVLILKGSLNRFTSGFAYDLLGRFASDEHQTIWVYAADLISVSRAGARGLIVAAKMQVSSGRKFFIVALTDDVQASLARIGFTHLLKFSSQAEQILDLRSKTCRGGFLHYDDIKKDRLEGVER